MAQRIKVGDTVVITAGKDKGKRGRVQRILKSKDRCIVEGINKVTRHKRRDPQNPSAGGRVEEEAPLHISNVMPWSDNDGKGVRVKMGEENGTKVRISVASGEVLAAAPVAVADDDAKSKKKKDADA